jgi:hypothetical protein
VQAAQVEPQQPVLVKMVLPAVWLEVDLLQLALTGAAMVRHLTVQQVAQEGQVAVVHKTVLVVLLLLALQADLAPQYPVVVVVVLVLLAVPVT